MEYRNYYNTPRDMIGEEMLNELLREKEPQSETYGNYPETRGGKQFRAQMPRNESGGNSGTNGSCGCRNSMRSYPNNGTPNCRGEYPAVPVSNVKNEWINPRLEGNPLSMVYSPEQEWEDLYEVEKALCRGTMFKKLDLVFYPACCSK